jgi:membrane-associated phospholipid phosphatase
MDQGSRTATVRGAAALVCIVLLGAALLADGEVAKWVHDSGLEESVLAHRRLKEIIKLPGDFWITVALAAAVGFAHRTAWRGALFVVICGVIGLVNTVLKWGIGRIRPYHWPGELPGSGPLPYRVEPFRGGLAGLFDQHDLAFPSGHACVAFLTAGALAVLLPRWRWPLLAGAAAVGVERVAENAHWLSDVVGAAILSLWGVWLIRRWVWARLFSGTAGGSSHE